MTVSSQINKIIYIGNGVAKEFAIPFSFLEQKHIKVEQKLENVQAERTDWSVKDGNLVFENAPESGAEIAIVRDGQLDSKHPKSGVRLRRLRDNGEKQSSGSSDTSANRGGSGTKRDGCICCRPKLFN